MREIKDQMRIIPLPCPVNYAIIRSSAGLPPLNRCPDRNPYSMKSRFLLLVALATSFTTTAVRAQVPTAPTTTSVPFPVSIQVDAGQSLGELRQIWRFFGADEPNYATMKDGRKLIGELGELKPRAVYFRAHNLLTSGNGTPALKWGSTGAYEEDRQGNAVYQWSVLDGILDCYLQR